MGVKGHPDLWEDIVSATETWWQRALDWMLVRQESDLARIQVELHRQVQRQAMRTLGGVVCYPSGALILLHPDDMRIWREFRGAIQQELDETLARVADSEEHVKLGRVQLVAQEDPSAQRGRPVITVDFLPVTSTLSSPPPAAAEAGAPPTWRDKPSAEVEAERPLHPRRARQQPEPEVTRPLQEEVALTRPLLKKPQRVREGALQPPMPGAPAQPLPGPQDGTMTVGRGLDQDWVLPPELDQASRRHLEITWMSDGTWEVVDVGSMHGSSLDGSPLLTGQPQRLGLGQMLFIADQGFTAVEASR